jgi:HD-GYP domain-containing protein (c-di-GMP phosphodiesterase class II)
MNGSHIKAGSKNRPQPGALEKSVDLALLTRRLMSEFGAPVGLFDPQRAVWLARGGLTVETCPKIPPGVIAETVVHGRAVVARAEESGRTDWLHLPVAFGPATLVAVVGFAAMAGQGPTQSGLGPPCPEPALRAWGQTVADRYRSVHISTSVPRAAKPQAPAAASPSSAARRAQPQANGDGGERMFVARLIRRLRISDPPERFQQLATNALRSALNVKAVAWVPAHHSEPVVISGEIGQLRPDGYRILIPIHAKDGIAIDNAPQSPPDPELRSSIAASADSHGSIGWLFAFNPHDNRGFTTLDAELLQPTASLISTQEINARVYADLKELLFGVIRALTAAIDAKDPYTSGHSERVARIAVRLSQELGMPANQRGDLYLMGLLHDVGKIGVDDAVLKKPGPLTPEEYHQIQLHVEIGVRILEGLKKLNHLLPGVRHHHESLDGSGYPCGLAGDAIPFVARILAVADSYDAMSSTRPYRRRLTPSQIDEILRKGAGVQWDPKVIDALFACRMDLEMIRQKGLGESLQLVVNETLGRT